MADLVLERHERLDAATAGAIDRLVARAAVHDGHSPVGEHTLLKLRAGDADAFAVVARDGGGIVGCAQTTRYAARGALPRRLATELLVDPAARGRGIGAALLDRVADEGRAWGAERLDAWAQHADAAAIGLAESRGMVLSRQLWQMTRRLDAPVRRVAAPDGARLTAFDPERDVQDLVRVVCAAFPDHPENGSFDEDDLVARQRLSWYDPAAILLARDARSGAALGLHWGKLDAGTRRGEVHLLAITPGAQGEGIGRWLLLEGLASLRAHGARLAYLYVDADSEPAVGLYRRAGFRHQHLDSCYALTLRAH